MSKPTPQAPAATRTEQDFLGTQLIPAEAYWGVHTARAVENFPISGSTVGRWPCTISSWST
jgi:aspartate ammonia-lyase